MKTSNKRHVDFCKWTGRIYRVSSIPSETKDLITLKMDDDIIQEMYNDSRSLESAFVGFNIKKNIYEACNIDGTIYLPVQEENLTEISTLKLNENSDVSITLYTNNKLLEVIINYRAVKTWYNHRMRNNFKFAFDYNFLFEIVNEKNELLKSISIPSKKFLTGFNTRIDLSDIKDLNNIKIFTKRIFKTYHLDIQKNKYFTLGPSDDDITFSRAETKSIDRKKYNIVISKTTKKNIILIELIKLNISKIYKSLDFYITGDDPNELHEILSIPIETLWNKKFITRKIQGNLDNKSIWCNNKTLNLLFSKKVVSI